MIIPMLCVTIFVILVVWFLLPRVARLMIHTPTAISIFVCLSMVQLMAVFISMRCTLCGHFLQVALTLILVRSEERFSRNAEIGRAVQQECRDRSRMPSSARKKKPTAASLASALADLRADTWLPERLGAAALESGRKLNWADTVRQLTLVG